MAEDFLSADIIAITGHRDYPDRGNFIRGLDGMRAKEYLFGGARGVDSDALEYLAKTQRTSKRTVIVPNRLSDQPLSTREITKRWSTSIIELRNSGPQRYNIRNKYLVDHSNHLRAFYDFRGKGGTFNTIEYARSRGKSFDVWSLSDYNREGFLSKSPQEFRQWTDTMKANNVNVSSVKGIILSYAKNFPGGSVVALNKYLGSPGENTVEGMWTS